MDFKLVSKNNMGIVITLILVILLSQSRFFDFLRETALGRMIILLLIIFISYTNKFLGLLAVLFIIIAFNQYDMNIVKIYEGFDGSGNTTTSAVMNDDILKQNLTNKSNDSQTIATTSSTASESFSGREGFCMTDRESNILRGKQSNTIPVFNNTRNQDDDINPSDKSVFSSSYSSF